MTIPTARLTSDASHIDHESQKTDHASKGPSVDELVNEEEYPEGGRDGVLTAIGTFLVFFVEFGTVNSIGVTTTR